MASDEESCLLVELETSAGAEKIFATLVEGPAIDRGKTAVEK